MVGNKEKSGRGAKGGNLGVRVGGGKGGKRLLEEKSVRVIGGEMAMSGNKEKG